VKSTVVVWLIGDEDRARVEPNLGQIRDGPVRGGVLEVGRDGRQRATNIRVRRAARIRGRPVRARHSTWCARLVPSPWRRR
jgi:hypothetical protein